MRYCAVTDNLCQNSGAWKKPFLSTPNNGEKVKGEIDFYLKNVCFSLKLLLNLELEDGSFLDL